MSGFTVKTKIGASPEEVFAAFADLDRAAERISGITGIERLTDGPVGAGTRWRETRVMMGHEATEEMEFTAFDPGCGYTVEAESRGTRYSTEFLFRQADGYGTEVTVRFEAKPVSLAAKLLAPLAWLMMGASRKCVEKDIEELKVHVEAGVQTDMG